MFTPRLNNVVERDKCNQTLQAAAIKISRTATPKPKVANEKLVFGATLSDHILEVDWTHDKGWGAPQIVPYHALQIDPAASGLHYGIQVRG